MKPAIVRVRRGLLDTSVVIAVGNAQPVELPDEAAISTLTLCGLHHGLLVSVDEQRPARLATLAMAERAFTPLPVDSRVAPHFGRLMAVARMARGARPRVSDALIAATAISHGLPLLTRERDLERLDVPELIVV